VGLQLLEMVPERGVIKGNQALFVALALAVQEIKKKKSKTQKRKKKGNPMELSDLFE